MKKYWSDDDDPKEKQSKKFQKYRFIVFIELELILFVGNLLNGNELLVPSYCNRFYMYMPLFDLFLESVDADHINEKSTFHHILIALIPNKKWRFMGVTFDQESLSRLTLRQLRIKASELGIPLYSRKSKADLVKGVLLYEEKKELEKKLINNKVQPSSETTYQSSSETKVVFLPRDPEWAYVFWEISDSDRSNAQKEGAIRLCLRLADVTNKNNGETNPGTLQEIVVDSHSTEWYLPIPLAGRDYKVELGYRIGHKWMSLAHSSSAKVPSLHPSEQILDQFVPFSLEAPVTTSSDSKIESFASEQPDSGLHERLYQSATTKFRTRRVGSEEFQEGFPGDLNSNNESGSGLWASGLNESGIGGVPQSRSFWLVADAELIVYGATDPSAKLFIEDEEVPLGNDGTFRLQVPFRDGIQNYSIKAIDKDGVDSRNITMKFERVTPVDNTNPNSKAESEWF